jgi:hypothetical protein
MHSLSAGVVSASIAFHLAREGARVTLAGIAPLGFERILLDNQEIDVSDAIVAALGARPRQAQIAVAESINCVPPVGYPKSTVQDFPTNGRRKCFT